MTLWTVTHQVPLSMGFSRQEYWRGLLFSSPGDPPYPGIEPGSLASPALAGGFFTTEPPGTRGREGESKYPSSQGTDALDITKTKSNTGESET